MFTFVMWTIWFFMALAFIVWGLFLFVVFRALTELLLDYIRKRWRRK